MNSLFEGDAGRERFWHNQKLLGFKVYNAKYDRKIISSSAIQPHYSIPSKTYSLD